MNKIKVRALGADVEMFLRDKKTGEIVSSEGIIEGSKYDPYCFDKDNKHFSTSLDNVLTEITIPPAVNSRQFIAYLNKAVAYVRHYIPKDLDVAFEPSASLHPRFLQTEQAQVFG